MDRIVLVPAGDQAPVGSPVAAEGDRVDLAGTGASDGACWVAAKDADLIETEACGLYLRVGRPTRIEAAGQPGINVEPGVYQLIRRQG